MNPTLSLTAVRSAVACLAIALAGCSSVSDLMSGDKLDYRSEANKTSPLEIPPDLTQLARESRYAPQAGAVSASTFQQPSQASNAAPPAVAPQQVGDLRLERVGETRYLVTSQTPDQLWPQLRAFWQERGFNLAVDSAESGVMETDWAENRAKLPQDVVRRTLGRIAEGLYSTGERDKFRTRVERGPQGTEVYISHRGMEEVLTGALRDNTMWRARPTDPLLESELLSRLMVKLGAGEERAQQQVAAVNSRAAGPVRARLVGAQSSTLQVDEPFDRAWRRVGLALDRSGFTVEDRDRSKGVYFVRYAEGSTAPKEKEGLLSRWFSFGSKDEKVLGRYRVAVQGSGNATTVSVLNAEGQPDSGAVAQRIASLLVDDLK